MKRKPAHHRPATRYRKLDGVLDVARLVVKTARMGILEGKNVLITGVLTDASLAFGVAQLAQAEGANIILTGAGRGLSLTKRTARKLDTEPDVLELDVTNPDHVGEVRDALQEKWGRVDAALHAIGFAPEACLGDDFMGCLLYTSPSPRDGLLSRMPSSA